jgi:hypothetical protein
MRIGRVGLPKEFGLSVCQSYFGKPSPQGLFQRLTFERSKGKGEVMPITFGKSTFI